MFEINNLEKKFTLEYVKGRKTFANVTISLMDFKEKKNRLEDIDYNVKHCLRNEITSMSIVIHDFGVDTINDKGQLFNMACAKNKFKDYLENNNIKVSELQPILNDVYASFIKDNSSKNTKTKNLPPNRHLETLRSKL